MSIAPNPPLTLRDVKENPKVVTLINGANDVMRAMGYTEHGHRHAGIVSAITRHILENLNASGREAELGQIAAYLHDIGNSINRVDHPISGANLAYHILTEMGMPIEEITPILGALGNHEELVGIPILRMSAALILADKSDVHYSRVQEPDPAKHDIHDRVNLAVQRSRLEVDRETKKIRLELEINPDVASVMEYFEIFLTRMNMCRRAAALVNHDFVLNVNGTKLN